MTGQTKIKAEQAAGLYRQGYKVKEIAEIMHYCQQHIINLLKLAGITQNLKTINPFLVEQMQTMRSEGYSISAICGMFGVSETSVKRHTVGIKRNGKTVYGKKEVKV